MSFTKKKTLLSILLFIGAVFGLLRFTPFAGLKEFEQSHYSIPIYSAQNNLLAVLPLENGLRREFLSVDQLDGDLINVILGSEDRRFYFHRGFDLISLIRASLNYAGSGEISSGASTITMQLVRMINPGVKGIKSKLLELFNALRLETHYSKKEILQAYINHLPFGSNIEGLKSASFHFLGKEVSSLSPEELLILMMIPRRPSDYNPLENSEANREAVLRTLDRLDKDLNVETFDEIYRDINEYSPLWPSKAPHFIQMIRSRLNESQWRSGTSVYSSLDEDFQAGAQRYLKETLDVTAENRISNGAVLAIDNKSGRILAYIGSADFYSEELEGQNDGVRILRQPGSTLKPFLYGKAVESGFGISTPLPDIPLEFGNREIYIPENYNERFNGPVRLSVALGSSLNVTAVYLLERVGVQPFLEKLLSAGFTSLLGKEDLGVGLALGNGEVSLWELVQGFSIFSRKGNFLPLTYNWGDQKSLSNQVYPPQVSMTIRNILSNNKNRILGFGRINPLNVGFDALFKTGTSNQFNNIWALGSTEDITVGVWMGNFSGETIIGSPGSSYPARIVVSLLKDFHKVDNFSDEGDFQKREICSLSGKSAGPHCLYTLEEEIPIEEALETCDWHRESSTFLPPEYTRWINMYHQNYEIDFSSVNVEIIQPRDGSLFYLDPTLPDEAQAIAVRIHGRNEVSLFINDRIVHKATAPFIYFQDVERGVYRIKAEGNGESTESTILIK